jgi:hypothetical protein
VSKPARILLGGRGMQTRALGPDDTDFYCLRYEVWYDSYDCAIRTKFRTCPGCLKCDQGRFNLKRHAPALRTVRFSLAGD